AFVGGRLIGVAVDVAADGGGVTVEPLIGLFVAGVIGVVATARVARLGADLVEDIRDELSIASVTQTLYDSVLGDHSGRRGSDVAFVVPEIREHVAQLLRLMPTGLFALGAALGLATLAPIFLVLVAPWLIAASFVGSRFVKAQCERVRAVRVAAERVHHKLASSLEGVRDLMAARAIDRFSADIGGAIDEL